MTKYNVNQNHLKFIKYLDGASEGCYTTLLNGISSIPNNSDVTVLVKHNRFKVFPSAFSEENNEKENKNSKHKCVEYWDCTDINSSICCNSALWEK